MCPSEETSFVEIELVNVCLQVSEVDLGSMLVGGVSTGSSLATPGVHGTARRQDWW